MSNAIRHLKTLSVDIGPRGSGTAEEAKAAEYIEDCLRGDGLEPERESFSTVTSFSWSFLTIYSLFVLAAAIFFWRPTWGLALSCLGLVTFILESNTFPILSSHLPGKPSQNIRAIIKPRSKAIRNVVICAHYDSSRWALNFSPSMVGNFRQSYLMMFGSMLLMVGLYSIAIVTPIFHIYFGIVGVLPAIVLLITMGFLIHREFVGEYTHGANDNASGVSVLLEVARTLAKNPPTTVNVEILATGAEEAGTVGMINYLRRHHIDKNTLFINLDNLGAGRLTVITKEGILGSKNSSPILLSAAHETVSLKKLPVDFRPYHLLTTDATAVMMRRFGAMGIMGIDAQGQLPNWHWFTDTFENVKPDNLENARELVLGIIRHLEA